MTWNYSMRERIRRLEQELPLDGTAEEADASAEKINEAVQRILGNKPAADAPVETEPEPEQLSRSEQRRKDRREAERARRFGR
jgi:hypothetical protein